MPALDLRLRVASPELIALPWGDPLEAWDPTMVALRDIPVGPSRHLVRFVEADGHLWALKALPCRTARVEYGVLRELENRALAAVRAAGVVVQPLEDSAILVTHYLERSWQYRRLLMRVPVERTAHRARLFDAVAVLLVDLHRNGIYWGDCSLANTLFTRDGQVIQAWMVDAETAELHPTLTDGQRNQDLEIMVENIAGGLLDVAARREEPPESYAQIYDEAKGVVGRYEGLWTLLHDEPVIGLDDQYEIEARLRKLNEFGFAVDEVLLETDRDQTENVRMKVAVAGRQFHSTQLRALTGLDAGEGQATILMNDLRGFHTCLQHEIGEVSEVVAARRWVVDAFTPGVERAHRAVSGKGDPVQAYCDLLEVRWLLSEQAGSDVGEEAALEALASGVTFEEAAATLAFVDITGEMPMPDVAEGGQE